MSLVLRTASRSDVGHVRQGNEDSGFAGQRLFAVADGMGGAAAGEVASTVVIAALAALEDDVPPGDLTSALADAVVNANTQLHDMVKADPQLDGMGTTVTAALSVGSRLGLVHVGDSRAYLYRDGRLTQITHDHTFVQSLVDSGQIDAAEAAHHPQRHLILRALDGRDDVELDLSVREVRAGDRYLLCTDGLHGVVGPQTIAEVMELPEPQQVVDTLVELALSAGGPDNVTVIVADVVDVAQATKDDGAQVVGAAAADETARSGLGLRSRTAAGRAALLGRPGRLLTRAARTDDDSPPAPRQPRWWFRRAAVAAVVLCVIVLAAVGSWVYVQRQYYVGTDGGQVAVFRGVSGSIAGVHLSSLQTRGVAVDQLPTYEQRRLAEGIPADSRADAQRILNQLAAERQACVTAALGGPTTSGVAGCTGGGTVPAPTGSPTPGAAPPTTVPTAPGTAAGTP
ncbi:MAG TPA: Stp1/IreP family PP2C-type Ser/Thr phosphatase [Frankiaceae bacterium]|nr:protein serine/threonine phosphatase [Mycobacterium sp.]